MTRLCLVDCRDSFTWNLVELFRREGAKVAVPEVCDSLSSILELPMDACILSPGPGRPSDWPLLAEILDALDPVTPVLGICLGHQAIGEHYGARLRREAPVHGEAVEIRNGGEGLFTKVPRRFFAMRYNSLGLDPDFPGAQLEWTAWGPAGEIMALRHVSLPRYGLQFHPDSILTPDGAALARAFLEIARGNRAGNELPVSLDSEASCAHSSAG